MSLRTGLQHFDEGKNTASTWNQTHDFPRPVSIYLSKSTVAANKLISYVMICKFLFIFQCCFACYHRLMCIIWTHNVEVASIRMFFFIIIKLIWGGFSRTAEWLTLIDILFTIFHGLSYMQHEHDIKHRFHLVISSSLKISSAGSWGKLKIAYKVRWCHNQKIIILCSYKIKQSKRERNE